jgi:hypothetical protein
MKFLVIPFILLTAVANAQTVFYQTLETSEFEVMVTADGRLFHTGGNDSLCESPAGGTFFREAGFWISAISQKGIHKAAHHHRISHDYGYGPLDTLFGFTADNQAVWNRVWKLTREDIRNHQEQYQLGEYVAPFDLKTWPVHLEGDYPQYNAPFVDYDQNGIYEPDSGDYPFVPGDQMIYCIYNDATGEGNSVDGFSLNTEIRAKYWVEKDQPNALFFELVFYNRHSEIDYDSTVIGVYADAVLGRTETYGETDIHQHAVYAYHDGAEMDEFDRGVPAAGLVIQAEDLHYSVILDGRSNHRKLPLTAREFRNTLMGIWTNGEKMTLGDSGVGGGTPVEFAFGGSTHSQNDSWRDQDEFDAGRRYLIGSVEKGTWERGSYKRLNGAIVMTSSGGLFEARKLVNDLKRSASVTHKKKVTTVKTWPNPSSGKVHLQSSEVGNSYVNVYTTLGELVYSNSFLENHDIPCNVFTRSGIYIIEVETPEEIVTIKQTIQR